VSIRAQVLGGSGKLLRANSPSTRHWAAWQGEKLVGCVTVVRLRGWALRGMAVLPEHRRHGVGRRLLQQVHSELACPLWCHARLASVPFYEALGWTARGPLFQNDEGPHQRMNWSPVSPQTKHPT
jgi:GNAT superfamily N-acetyltransferase